MNRPPQWCSRVCLTLSVALLGCSDSSSPTLDVQSVVFQYAGQVSGQFRAAGPATAAGDQARSFAVAFLSDAGETQLCAYQPAGQGNGHFFLLNIGVISAPGRYVVPPGWAPNATSYQPGTFLLGVDPTHTTVEQISTFSQGEVEVEELSPIHVRGGFTIRSRLTTMSEGRFDVTFAELEELPIICQ